MVEDDLQGGTVLYGESELPATMGVFSIRQRLTSGGFSPSLMATVEVAACDLPQGTEFENGQPIIVTPNTGQERQCRIESAIQQGALWQIDVMDINENA